MSGLVSKVLAGGLSAGIFLLWWPAHVTAQGNEWLFVRGILWSLAFELLLLAYKPLEAAITGAVRDRGQLSLTTLRSPRLARLLMLAAVGVAVPAVMLAGARPPVATPASAAAPKVIVKHEVVRREVVVRRVNHVVRVPGPTVTTPAPAGAAAPASTPRSAAAAAPARTKTTTSQVVAGTTKDTGAKPKATPKTTTAPATATTPAAAQTAASAGTGTSASSAGAGPATPAAAATNTAAGSR
jgi:hypothetical protein